MTLIATPEVLEGSKALQDRDWNSSRPLGVVRQGRNPGGGAPEAGGTALQKIFEVGQLRSFLRENFTKDVTVQSAPEQI